MTMKAEEKKNEAEEAKKEELSDSSRALRYNFQIQILEPHSKINYFQAEESF